MSGHYFDSSPDGPATERQVRFHGWGRELTCTTAGGVFSHDHLDHATAVLLRELDPPTAGTVLDLGCGWGPIACLLATVAPEADVWAVDVNDRARELTAANADRLGVRMHVTDPDGVPETVRFDQIWSNPPIRIGKDALHDLLLTWIDRLADEGELLMVVGKNLGADTLMRWLNDQGHPTDRVASSKGFRVLRTRRA